MYLICDDVNEGDFHKLEELKLLVPSLKVNCFVMGKDAGDYLLKDWIEVGVHGFEHTYPPECERDNQREYITKGLEALKKYLPINFGFRAPGFQIIASTYSILKELGFCYIAHQSRIQVLQLSNFPVVADTIEEADKEIRDRMRNFKQYEIINTHIYDDSLKKVKCGDFHFIWEGFW